MVSSLSGVGAKEAFPIGCFCLRKETVAPHAGARIETDKDISMALVHDVAPHAGARIET